MVEFYIILTENKSPPARGDWMPPAALPGAKLLKKFDQNFL
jgi:hypothetical protein